MTPVAVLLKRMLAAAIRLAGVLALLWLLAFAAESPVVSLVVGEEVAKPVEHGLGKPVAIAAKVLEPAGVKWVRPRS